MSLLLLFRAGSAGPTLTDVGVTITDSIARKAIRPRALSSVGVTITDTLVKNTLGTRTVRTLSDTGVTITDTIAVGAQTRIATDAYADGASLSFGAATVSTSKFSVFTDAFDSYIAPDDETSSYYGRLPLPEAQAKLSETAVESGSAVSVECTWHGQVIDAERGSFILVRADGELQDRIGRRVRISVRGSRSKSVVGYVHGIAPLSDPDEVSVSRRLFMELSLPGFDRVPVTVETLKT